MGGNSSKDGNSGQSPTSITGGGPSSMNVSSSSTTVAVTGGAILVAAGVLVGIIITKQK